MRLGAMESHFHICVHFRVVFAFVATLVAPGGVALTSSAISAWHRRLRPLRTRRRAGFRPEQVALGRVPSSEPEVLDPERRPGTAGEDFSQD